MDVEKEEVERAGVEPQQVLATPPCTSGHASLYIPSSPMEVTVQVHVEEADLDTL